MDVFNELPNDGSYIYLDVEHVTEPFPSIETMDGTHFSRRINLLKLACLENAFAEIDSTGENVVYSCGHQPKIEQETHVHTEQTDNEKSVVVQNVKQVAKSTGNV